MAKVDWAALEMFLVNAATKQLAAFAEKHPSEVFYGAIFDVETYEGPSVSLLLNTEAHAQEEWGDTVDRKDLHRRFLPASFLHDLPLTKGAKAFPDDEIMELVEQDMEDDETGEDGNWATACKLLDVVCAAAFTLENGALAKLSRTPDFAISVTPDPSEPGDFAIKRYAKFRKERAKSHTAGAASSKAPSKPKAPPGKPEAPPNKSKAPPNKSKVPTGKSKKPTSRPKKPTSKSKKPTGRSTRVG